MKHKAIKIILGAAAAAVIIGGVCLGAGVARGGSPVFFYDGDRFYTKENTRREHPADHQLEETAVDSFENLDIQVEHAFVELVSGEDYQISYLMDGYKDKPEWEVKNNTLIFRESEVYQGERPWYSTSAWWGHEEMERQSPYLRITMPEDAALQKARIASENGSIAVRGQLEAEESALTTGDGRIELESWKGEKLELEADCGDVFAGTISGNSIAVENQYGNVQIDNLAADGEIAMEGGKLQVTVEPGKKLYAQNSQGETLVALRGTIPEFGVSLHTQYGTIRIPEGVVYSAFGREDGMEETETDYIRLKDEKALVSVYTENGDITVREK